MMLVKKSIGLSSNFILQKLKKICGSVKAGHGGSLDPIATGVLPVFFGRATKYSEKFL